MRRLAFTYHARRPDGTARVYTQGTPEAKVDSADLEQMGGEHLWENVDDDDAAAAAPAPPAEPDGAAPTLGGAEVTAGAGGLAQPAGNASGDAWREYARSVGVPVADDAGREDVRAELRDRGLLTE